MIHVSVPSGFGRVNYVGGTDVAEFSTAELFAFNDFPLVAVNTSKNHNFWWAALVLVNSVGSMRPNTDWDKTLLLNQRLVSLVFIAYLQTPYYEHKNLFWSSSCPPVCTGLS